MLKNQPPKKKLELVQAFRGLAALLVVLFHTSELTHRKFNQDSLSNIFHFGSAGVDFFFVLSGFIIYFIHRTDLGHRDKLKPFLVKRLIRVYPMYWVVTLTLLPIYFLIPSFGLGDERNVSNIIKSLLLLPQKHLPVLIVGWSLSYEVFFYLVFSFAIFLNKKLAKFIIFSWLSITLAVWLLELRGFQVKYFWLTFIFNSHNLEFALGCLSAYLVSRNTLPRNRLFLILGILLFILFGICDNYNLINVSNKIVYGIPSMLIILGASSLDISKSVKVPPLFLYLGDASYSIYLVHYPCLSSLIKVATVVNLGHLIGYFSTISLIIIITLGVGLISYYCIEKPLLVFSRKKISN